MDVKNRLFPICQHLLSSSKEHHTNDNLTLPKLKFEADNEAGAALTVHVIGIPESSDNYSSFQFGLVNGPEAGKAPMSQFEMVGLEDKQKKGSGMLPPPPTVMNVNSWILKQVKVLLPELKATLGGNGVNCKHVSFHGFGLCGAVAAVLGIFYSIVYAPSCIVSAVSLNAPRFTDNMGQKLIWKTLKFYYFCIGEDYASPGTDGRRVQIPSFVRGVTRFADPRLMFPPQKSYKCTGRMWLYGEPSPGQPATIVPVPHSQSNVCTENNETSIRDVVFLLDLEQARKNTD